MHFAQLYTSSIVLGGLICVGPAGADVVSFTNRAAWESAATSFTTITFQGYPANTNITDQYADFGVLFTDGIDLIHFNNSFPNDLVGINGAFDSTTLEFSRSMTSIAVEYPGTVRIRLYASGKLFHQSTFPGVGQGFFAGLISTQPFDSAIISDPSGGLFVDDLHFGPPIAVPGDISGDGKVDIADLLAAISSWGSCPPQPQNCDADVYPHPGGNGIVNVQDLLFVIANWG